MNPAPKNAFEISESLSQYLNVIAPNTIPEHEENSYRPQTVAQFSRERILDVNWGNYIDTNSSGLTLNLVAFRQWVESSWAERKPVLGDKKRALLVKDFQGEISQLFYNFPNLQAYHYKPAKDGMVFLLDNNECLLFQKAGVSSEELLEKFNIEDLSLFWGSIRDTNCSITRARYERKSESKDSKLSKIGKTNSAIAFLRPNDFPSYTPGSRDPRLPPYNMDLKLPRLDPPILQDIPAAISSTDAQNLIENIIRLDSENELIFQKHVIKASSLTGVKFARLKGRTQPESQEQGMDNNIRVRRMVPLPSESVCEEVQDGAWLIHHKGLDVYFELRLISEGKFSVDTQAAYDYSWRHYVVSVNEVYPLKNAEYSKLPFSFSNYVDLGPIAITQEYFRWKANYEIIEAQKKLAKKILENIEKDLVSLASLPTNDERISLANIFYAYEALAIQKRAIKQQAADLGYVLWTEESKTFKPFAGIKGAPENLQAIEYYLEEGALYRTSPSSVNWVNTTVKRGRCSRSVSRHHRSHNWVTWTKVDVRQDPEMDYVESCQELGLEVIVFDTLSAEAISRTGVAIADLIEQCSIDKDFRSNLVIMLPVFDSSSIFGQRVIGYKALHNPLPGFRVIAEPELTFTEQLSYRMRWIGTQLGELLESINLAPGETRTVTVRKTTNRRQKSSNNSTSLVENSASSASELTKQIESEIKNTSKTETQTSWSADAKGSVGAFSGGASASGSRKTSTEKFARNFSSIVSKSAQTLQNRSKTELTISNESETSDSQTVENTGQFTNINHGSTLNILFYQLNNFFKSGLYLDEIGFSLRSGTELIHGSDILWSRNFELYEISHLFEEIKRETFLTTYFNVSANEAAFGLLDRLITILKNEYVSKSLLIDKEQKTKFESICKNVDVRAENLKEGRSNEDLKDAIDELKTILEQASQSNNAIGDFEYFALPSDAMYLDSLLGIKQSVEPYAQKMRELELRKIGAEASIVERKAENESSILDRMVSLSAQNATKLIDPLIENITIKSGLATVFLKKLVLPQSGYLILNIMPICRFERVNFSGAVITIAHEVFQNISAEDFGKIQIYFEVDNTLAS